MTDTTTQPATTSTQSAPPVKPPVGCAPIAAETFAIFLSVALWIPLTYLLLPLLHETTPLAYSVTTALVLLLANGVRRVLVEGAANVTSNTMATNTTPQK